MKLKISSRNALLEERAFPISHRVAVQHAVRRRDGGSRRAGGRLPEFHVDDRAAFGFHLMREPADADCMERRDFREHGISGEPPALSHIAGQAAIPAPRFSATADRS